MKVVIQTLVVLVAVWGIQGTPIHSNTNGVTECPDALIEMYNSLNSSRAAVSCTSVKGSLELLLDSCRPSNPEYISVLLKQILDQFYYSSPECQRSEDPEAAPVPKDCGDAFMCLQPLLTSDTSINCASGMKEEGTSCLQRLSGNCAIAQKLRYTVEEGSRKACSRWRCVTSDGIFETVPNANCQLWTWTDPRTGVTHGPFPVAPGTMFQTDICTLQHAGSGACYN